jgi:hypothetical protein
LAPVLYYQLLFYHLVWMFYHLVWMFYLEWSTSSKLTFFHSNTASPSLNNNLILQFYKTYVPGPSITCYFSFTVLIKQILLLLHPSPLSHVSLAWLKSQVWSISLLHSFILVQATILSSQNDYRNLLSPPSTLHLTNLPTTYQHSFLLT